MHSQKYDTNVTQIIVLTLDQRTLQLWRRIWYNYSQQYGNKIQYLVQLRTKLWDNTASKHGTIVVTSRLILLLVLGIRLEQFLANQVYLYTRYVATLLLRTVYWTIAK